MVLLNARRKDRLEIEDIESAKHENISENHELDNFDSRTVDSRSDSVWETDNVKVVQTFKNIDNIFENLEKITFQRRKNESIWSCSHFSLPFGTVLHDYISSPVFKCFDASGKHILNIKEKRRLSLFCWTGWFKNTIEVISAENDSVLACILDDVYGACFTCTQPGYLLSVHTKVAEVDQKTLLGYLDPIKITNSSLLGCVSLEANSAFDHALNNQDQFNSYKIYDANTCKPAFSLSTTTIAREYGQRPALLYRYMRRTSDEFAGKLQHKLNLQNINETDHENDVKNGHHEKEELRFSSFQLTFAGHYKLTPVDKLMVVLQASLIDIEGYHLNQETKFTVLNAILQLVVAFGVLFGVGGLILVYCFYE